MRKCEKESKAGCSAPKNPASSAAESAIIARYATPAVMFERAPPVVMSVVVCRTQMATCLERDNLAPALLIGQIAAQARRRIASPVLADASRSRPLLLEGRFGKASKLARMQPLHRHFGQLLHRLDTDSKMLRHLPLVEFRRHAGQLQLAMQRLVGDAEQRAMGHPEAEAVGSDGGRLHVERDGSGLRQTLHRSALVAQFPVAVVDGGDCAGAHDALQIIAG